MRAAGVAAIAAVLDVVVVIAMVGGTSATPSPGCERPVPAFQPGTSTDQWLTTPDGLERVWRVHVPPSYVHNSTAGAPVVLALHGGSGNGNQTERDYLINDEAALRGFIVLYPTGYGAPRGTWNAGACCGPSMTQGIDEVGFLLQVLDAAEAALCTDRSRVYATGMSNGGLMALRLACEASDRIAAVAPVAASLEFFPCTPSLAVGVMMVHGTGDRNIYWEGGPGCGVSGTNFTSIPVSIDTACAFNGCGCAYADRAQCGTPYYSYGDGECIQHGGAPANASTVLCAIHGGGHKWPQPRDAGEPMPTPPADPDECDKTVGDFPTNAAMWQFFTLHTRAF